MKITYIGSQLVTWKELKVGDRVKVHLAEGDERSLLCDHQHSVDEYHPRYKEHFDAGTIFIVKDLEEDEDDCSPVLLRPEDSDPDEEYGEWIYPEEMYEIIERA